MKIKPEFDRLTAFGDMLSALPSLSEVVRQQAEARNACLTKPAGALGQLEALAIWYASWRGTPRPRMEAPQILVFAGNHGVAQRGVSAFPHEVTAQMVANFKAGGAAINQLAALYEADFAIHAFQLETPTADFTKAPAMREEECIHALKTGWQAVSPKADLVIVGEMGIANTTASAALACALYGGQAHEWAGRGTGVDDAQLAQKARIIDEGLAFHGATLCPLEALCAFGGYEMAAMVGAIAGARAHSIPVLLDGFICSASAAVLEKTCVGALDHCWAGHVSAEGGHRRLLEALDKKPLLALDMRLGEGTGAAVALGILKSALACHAGMASFDEAGVSEKSS